jgi:hypothetical protein
MAKRFFFVSLGILCLAAAYHLGVVSSQAQGGGEIAGVANLAPHYGFMAVTTGGDVYATYGIPQCTGSGMVWSDNGQPDCIWTLVGNILDGPIPAKDSSFGAIKSHYRQ